VPGNERDVVEQESSRLPVQGIMPTGMKARQKAVIQMQRIAGNAATIRLLEGKPERAQRETRDQNHETDVEAGDLIQTQSHSATLQRTGEEGEALTPEFFNFSGVQDSKVNFERRFENLAQYATLGLRVGDRTREKLLAMSETYRRGYDRYAGVIRAGRLEARNQERWIGICVGVGASVLAGMGAAFILPSTAAGWFALTAAEAGTALASAAGQAALSAAATDIITRSMSVAGSNLEPGGLDPNVQELAIWRNVANLYRRAAGNTDTLRSLHRLSMVSEQTLGEIRVHVAGGTTTMPEEQLLDNVERLVRADQAMNREDADLDQKLTNLRRLEEQITALDPGAYSESQMEKDIWILWMAELSDPSVLDLDEIEDHLHAIGVLGAGSILGVDFGVWTSDEDEIEARNAARSEAAAIRRRMRTAGVTE